MKTLFKPKFILGTLIACTSLSSYAIVLPVNMQSGDPITASAAVNVNTQVNTNTSNIDTLTPTRVVIVKATTSASTNGTNLANAINNLSLTPLQEDPVLIKLEPGSYALQADLTIPSYVSIEGSGANNGSVTDASNLLSLTGVTSIIDNGHNLSLAGNNQLRNLAILNNSSSAYGLRIGTSNGGTLTGPVSLNHVTVSQTDGTGTTIYIAAGLTAGNDILFADHLQVYHLDVVSAGPAIQAYSSISGNIELHNSIIQANGSDVAISLTKEPTNSDNFVYAYNSIINGKLDAEDSSSAQYFMTSVTMPAAAAISASSALCAYSTQYNSTLSPLGINCQ